VAGGYLSKKRATFMFPMLLYLLRNVFLVFLSSLLLVLSFPKFEYGVLAWVGLLPLLISIHDKSLRVGFFLSLVCGILFFLGIFYWILEVQGYTLFHHGLLAIYLGLYFGLFGFIFNFILKRMNILTALLAAPFLWVSLEYLRSNLSFLALPLSLLGYSQYRYPIVIQIASLAGTYGVSFLIVLVNAALASLFIDIGRQKKPQSSEPWEFQGRLALVTPATLFLILTFLYGYVTLIHPITGKKIKIGLAQGNIEQAKKWDTRYARHIMQTYSELTEQAASNQPSLIIWPETATPGAISFDPIVYAQIKDIANKFGTYLLLGSAQHQKFEGKGAKGIQYLNSAYLISPDPEVTKNQRYDKIRLFPFGEYLPFKEMIPWWLINVRDSGSYTAGNEFTIFRLPAFSFGVTICWENVFPDIVRQAVNRGAQFIVNITNEARFGRTAAPYQLAAVSVFRAVENRIFVIRCANTGVSCIIDPYGRITNRIKDERGQDTFVRGILSEWVVPLESKTFFTRYGDWPVWVSYAGLGLFLLIAFLKWLER
jgi:apolipoprotein N-acyltransferase